MEEPTSKEGRESFLSGVRVLEVANELGEYCGKLLAGLGADVVKVEPASGEETRGYGPFYQDERSPDRSLYFWHYNFGKRGITLDLDGTSGQADFRSLLTECDVLIDTRPRGYLAARGFGAEALELQNPRLVYCRITPFGDDGPWSEYEGSDLVHLALGGVAMNCGYDPEPGGRYDLPPIAPQMWQSYQIAGEMAAMAVVSALVYRMSSGRGQRLSTSVHDAVSKNTETDLPNWVYLRQTHYRRTCRHSLPTDSVPALAMTKDGRWLLPYRSYLPVLVDLWGGTVSLLEKYGLAGDLSEERYQDPSNRSADIGLRLGAQLDRLVGALQFSRELWLEAQAKGLPWAPLRRPEENLTDRHWRSRETFLEVEHAELGRSFSYVGAKWLAPGIPWRRGPRAPLLGEHNEEVLGRAKGANRRWADEGRTAAVEAGKAGIRSGDSSAPRLSPHGRPFALRGVRIVDMTWLLASAGAGRFFAALGAEVIKVEHESRWDGMRWGAAPAPLGGRAERDRASEPIKDPQHPSPNRRGFFMEINSGKLGISLNLKHERGRELLWQLIKDADMVIEGFSPGTMDRMGFGYDALRAANPRIIYVQQSGMGQIGTYGATRSFGPTAQALSGISEMSGLPEPYPPAGIGYSYLDWFGAYNMATAMMAALYRQRMTGRGCYIDSSQVEAGTYLTGTAVLDFSANGRRWQRYGNRSPYKIAAPHGIYRTTGEDRWIAISCYTEQHWQALQDVLALPKDATNAAYGTVDSRVLVQDELDALIGEATTSWDGYELMQALQAVGVPAGVCQTAQDRYERDPQLAHFEWLTELEQSEIGRWPVKEFPVTFSETPSYIGGFVDRSGPSYGEDNAYVFGKLLGLSEDEIRDLRTEGVI